MSRARGLVLQNALAAYLRAWWPDAESAGSGRPGTDVLRTPGIVWENKTADHWDVLAWVRQARSHAKDPIASALPVTVYWPRGVGRDSPAATLAILPLPDLVELLINAGYGNSQRENDGVLCPDRVRCPAGQHHRLSMVHPRASRPCRGGRGGGQAPGRQTK